MIEASAAAGFRCRVLVIRTTAIGQMPEDAGQQGIGPSHWYGRGFRR